jgi:hypothetical protein
VKKLGLINVDAVKKQLDDIPTIKYPHVESLVKNDDLISEIASIEGERIWKNKEDIISSCNDIHFRMLGRKREKDADIWYDMGKIMKLCRGHSPTFIHFHGPYLGYLSPQDDDTNKEAFFKDGAKASCAVGIDGMHCRTNLWHYIRMPWTDRFYDMMKKERNIETLKNVKTINCVPKKDKNGSFITCDITFMNGRQKYTNVFSEVGCEYDNNFEYLYANMSDESKNIIPIVNVYRNEGVYCSIMEMKPGKRKRILACFKTKNF